jgi:DNA-binding NarL/FixJ family response regulator
MAVVVAELSHRAAHPVTEPSARIGVLIVCECPLFRVGLRAILAQQCDVEMLGETTQLEDVLALAREQRPDVVLLDGSLTTTDPLDLVRQLRQEGVAGILVFAPPTGDEETLFRFLMSGAMAYEDGSISGEELLAKLHRVARGECLLTGEVLVAQVARRERLARLRRDALLAASLAEARLSAQQVQQVGNSKRHVSEDDALLSLGERAVLEQIARGRTNAQVAQALGISPHTVKNRLNTLY